MRPAHLAKRPIARFVLLAGLGVLTLQACWLDERDDILILVRAGDLVSRSIAEDYATARNISEERILTLELTGDANISLATFESEIAAPLEKYLATRDPDAGISILVTTLGIPIRIGHCEPRRPQYPKECLGLAVDAALAGLGRLDLAIHELRADNHPAAATGSQRRRWIENPYFGDPRPFKKFRQQESDARLRFMVARLTGPPAGDETESKTPASILRMIDGASQEEDTGHAAPVWQVFARQPPSTRDFASAALLSPLDRLLSRRGIRICDGCLHPPANASRPVGAIVQQRPRASEIEQLVFPGLVLSLGPRGRSLSEFNRSVEFWTSKGARAISMHLDDPSLGGVTRPAMFLRAWLDGRTALEAHFNSVPHLGWTNVFVGDPLLRLARPADRMNDDIDGDFDGDGIPDNEDNCLDVANSDQRDSNSDGIGNRCDPDVNNDGRVDTSWGNIYPIDSRGDLERIALTALNGPYDPDHDLDGDGSVNEHDLALAQLWLFRRPGPSGRRPERR
jgi:hypothetical protein